jgi:translocation and assembly module TamA
MQRIIRHLLAIVPLILICSSVWAALTLTNEITGLQDPSLKNAQNRLKIAQKKDEGKLTQKKINTLFEGGRNEILEAIKPYGYFKGSVTANLTNKDNDWTAQYHVSQGFPLHVTELTIKTTGPGKNDKHLQKYLKNFPIKDKDIFNTDTYNKAKNKLLNIAQERGYLNAKLSKNTILINLRNYSCAILITLDTGPRFYFNGISFSKTPLEESLLRRYVNFKSGEAFSYSRLLDLQQLLTGSGYFQSVDVVPEIDKVKNQRVPTQVNLTMQKRKSYNFGVGYGTNTGVRLTLGFQDKWVNKWGHKFNANFRISPIDTNLIAQYVIPGKSPAHEQYAVTAAMYMQQPKVGKSFTTSIGVSQLRNYTNWQRSINLDYQWEKYRVYDNDPTLHSRILTPGVTFSYTKTDKQNGNIINVDNGSRFDITLRGATTFALSTVNFIQSDMQYKWIKSFFNKNWRILLRGDIGYTAVDDLEKLPLSKRFYAGGIDSIRGFGYKDIGPGKYLILGSAEFQQRIYKTWYAAVFYDMGNAMNDWGDPLNRSIGGGVVWQSPLGPLRLYIARAISDRDKPFRIEFSLGPDL